MAKGEVPVAYIIALIMAIVIITVVAYMFFTHTGIFVGESTKAQCDAKYLNFCMEWSSNWDTIPEEGFDEYAPECDSFGYANANQADCMSKVGISG